MNWKPITKLNRDERGIFRSIWNVSDRYAAFELAQSIRPELTREQLERAYVWTNIFSPYFKQAVSEFIMMVNQTF